MTENKNPLRIGTRGSKLALVQANLAAGLLRGIGAASEIVVLKTTGDRIVDRPLADAGGKGLFVKELEDALLNNTIDLAVHSMKDVPVDLPPGLDIAAVLKREDPRDVFVSNKAKRLIDLPQGAVLGTSSVRREAQVRRVRPDLKCVLLRGNVDTRLRKLDDGEMDAMLLALAGLKRLGLEARATQTLDDFLPALSQGAIGIEIRNTDARAREIVTQLNDTDTQIALDCERAFQRALGGSCRSPMAGLATVRDGVLSFHGEVIAPDGSKDVDTSLTLTLGPDPRHEAEEAGYKAGAALKPRALQWLDL
ncbi:MAG TPA: hydroxymethylbilane synthase [Rhizomicrobium sp.]|nr:hydroxymethylbilane synthase [Rhizomicrobium sp.]